MKSIKNYEKIVLLTLAAFGLYECSPMFEGGLRRRHVTADGSSLKDKQPLVTAQADQQSFLGACTPLVALGSEEELRRERDAFIRQNQAGSGNNLFGLRPILVGIDNKSNLQLIRDVAGESESCNSKMMPTDIRAGESRWILFNAPRFLADGATVFVTFSFTPPGQTLQQILVGVTLDQVSIFRPHSTRVMVCISPPKAPVRRLPCFSKEGKEGPKQDCFGLVRRTATRSHSASEYGNFGIVAQVDQTVPCSRVANYTVVHVVFTDENSLAQQLGHTPEPAAPPSAESTPPSRTTSQSSSSN